MSKIILILLVVFLFFSSGCIKTETKEEFCGWNSDFPCKIDSECKAGGCSGQVCGGAKEQIFSTCEFKECYNPGELKCKCLESICKWI